MNNSAENNRVLSTDVAVVGDINPDLILYGLPADLPEERELLASSFVSTLGGSSAILAHNLATLGTSVSLSGVIGPDVMGSFCLDRLVAAGVDTSRVRRPFEGEGTGVTVVLPNIGKRRILTFPGSMAKLTLADLDVTYLGTARHFHISSPFLQTGLLPDIPSLLKEMKLRGLTTSIDPNDVPVDEGARFFKHILPFVDIVFCTEEEFARFNPHGSGPLDFPEDHILVLKRGVDGAALYYEGQCIDLPGLTVNAVDSIGAGDSFDAGFLHQWLREASLDECGRFANLIAALSVTRPGGTEALRDAHYREQFMKENWGLSFAAEPDAVEISPPSSRHL